MMIPSDFNTSLIALRLLRLSEPSHTGKPDGSKTAVGRGGHRLEASRNYWDGSDLKVDSVSTDIAWGRGGRFYF
jgi:WD repeat-containing protein 24